MEYRQVHKIGGKGSAPDQFTAALRGIALDRQGQVYAAGDSEIKIFDGACGAGLRPAQGRSETCPTIRRRFSTARPGHSVAVAADRSIWVGEPGQIEIFDSAGKLVNTWRNADTLGLVTEIGFTQDHVLAGDAKDRAIRRFDRQGNLLNTIGKDNNVRGFLIPNGAVDFGVDAQGIIDAANPGKHRVERYKPSGELLGHIGRFGMDPAGFPGCCNPTNVAVTAHGVCVTEKAGPRVKLYSFGGELLAVIAAGVFDLNCKNMDIAVDARGRVYVADTVKLEIFVFEPAGGGAS